MISGIDVSSVQGADYGVSGRDFVFVKATEGHSYTSPVQGKQAALARTAGLALGFYHFLWPGNIAEQAAYFVQQCASLPGDMLVCDWETTEDGTWATCAEKDAFLAEVKRLRPAHRVGLYCNTDYWLHRDTTSDAGDFLWIADPGQPAPRIQHPWTFWQKGEQNGTDLDVCIYPSRAALRTWCGYR